jgi:adenylate kinase
MPFHVVYLTGAPASGKSTILRALHSTRPDVRLFEYGAELTSYLQQRDGMGHLAQADVRSRSSGIVTPADVKAVDEKLLSFVEQNRASAHVVIDSHAVTKESYGFRVTPFSVQDLERLRPTQIWTLFTTADVAVARIKSDPGGRPVVTEWEADTHTGLQASVAINYGTYLGIPAYFFDANCSVDELVGMLSKRLG